MLSKHKDLMTQTKQLFFHKIGTYILYESSPLVIYACVSLSMVTFYGNYMILIGYAVTLLNVIFEGMGASIGNLVAENNKEHTMEVFWELFTSRFWLAAVCCFVTYIFVSPFIVLWIGEEYLLDKATLVLMIVSMFIRISRSVIDSFKNAYKLFADIWAPVIEAAINLSLSLLLGYYWGLNGILIGVNISLIVIVIFWKPYYVYKRGFCISIKGYIKEYIVHLVLTAIAIIACVKIENYINLNPFDSYYSLIAYMVIMSLLFICISYGLFFLFTSGMRMFSKRILILLKIK